jgi:hypothetical protein
VIAIINLRAREGSAYRNQSNVQSAQKSKRRRWDETTAQLIAVCPTEPQSFVSVGDGLDIGPSRPEKDDRGAHHSAVVLRPPRAKKR